MCTHPGSQPDGLGYRAPSPGFWGKMLSPCGFEWQHTGPVASGSAYHGRNLVVIGKVFKHKYD